jgi:uncharacterized protein YcaQ
MPVSLEALRSYALRRTLFPETTLARAVARLGFIQADPLRAPARAQDLTLLQRVKGYRAGDLERRYAELGIEEGFFVNYGFLSREAYALMHPRSGLPRDSRARARKADEVLAFVRQRGLVHPREVDRHLGSGTEKHWSGSSSTTTRLLDALHYRGLLRVARREGGIRLYAPAGAADAEPPRRDGSSGIDALVDLAVAKYAPLPSATLSNLVLRLRYAAPQWRDECRSAFDRAKHRLASERVNGVEWFWPATERLSRRGESEEARVRLLAPFDPVVWDRRRFELFWSWAYRFEAYTPRHRRKLGYYALPLLWGERVLGWANLAYENGRLTAELGYVAGNAPRDPVFRRELSAELARFERFLSAAASGGR